MSPTPTVLSRTLLGLGMLAAIAIAFCGAQPLRAKSTGAPSAEFSGHRAHEHSFKFAYEPRARGGAAAARGRDYLARACEEIGLEVEIDRRPINFGGSVAFVENVLARIPGTANEHTLGVTAHYDSVAWGPGAADDGAGCVVMLEAARVLMCQPRFKNDVVFVFTGDEEGGGNGSVNALSHPWLKDLNVMIGLEGRGCWGTPYMFETSKGNYPLLKEMAKMDIPAVANSIMYEVHRRTPNTTDFTHMADHGALGYNVAFVGGLGYYHTANDAPKHLSPDTLQHQGEYVLSILQHYGNDGPKIARGQVIGKDDKDRDIYEDAVFFNTLGHHLVVYSVTTGRTFSIAAAIVFLIALIIALATRTVRVRHLLLSIAIILFTIIATFAIGQGLLYISYKLFYVYIMYNSFYYHVAFMLLGASILLALFTALRRHISPEAIQLALLLLFSLALSIAETNWTSQFATWALTKVAGGTDAHPILAGFAALKTQSPAITYAFTWPLLFGALGLAIASILRRYNFPREYSVPVQIISALPPLFFIVPGTHALYHMGGALSPAANAVLVLIVLLAIAPGLLFIFANGARRTAIAALALATLIFFTGWVVQLFPNADRPKMNTLTYALNLDTQKAAWLTSDTKSDSWIEQFIPNTVNEESPFDDVAPGHGATARRADAPIAPQLHAPELTMDPGGLDIIDGKRQLTLHYTTKNAPEETRILVTGKVLAATIDGIPGELSIEPRRPRRRDANATPETPAAEVWSVNIAYLPHDYKVTLHLTLEAPADASAPTVPILIQEDHFHLPELSTLGYTPRPEWCITRGNTLGWWENTRIEPNHTYLTKTFNL